jgi:hypothetical protein
MIDEARQYLASRTIARREPLYSANRIARLIGDIPIAELTTEVITDLRGKMLASGLAPRTVESTISDLLTVAQYHTGKTVNRGHRVRYERPQPTPVEIDVVNAIWPHCAPWMQTWIAFTYWTGLRLTDSMGALNEYRDKPLPPVMRWRARKTGKHHVFPIPGWLRSRVESGPYRFRTTSDFAKRQIRAALHFACLKSACETVLPKQFRQRAITEWSIVNANAGAFIHGRDIGILNHYVDPLAVLESAAPRVRLPTCFGATQDCGESLLRNFQRCDEQAKSIVALTAERLAAG